VQPQQAKAQIACNLEGRFTRVDEPDANATSATEQPGESQTTKGDGARRQTIDLVIVLYEDDRFTWSDKSPNIWRFLESVSRRSRLAEETRDAMQLALQRVSRLRPLKGNHPGRQVEYVFDNRNAGWSGDIEIYESSSDSDLKARN
jgi:hypothetical protein